ncbi:hypothetical protein [Salinicoccus albus]|uniref:hypothetical protein n=1 Tax=Salinicoccus albus TaxID=418756 RepID=UPI00035DAA1B|nr:hypothetical protein [Salinicoccus albus]
MGFFEFLVAFVPSVLIFTIPLYAIGRSFKQKDKRLELKKAEELKELERLKQENYILENRQMQHELDKLKAERAQERLDDGKADRWLIAETKDRETQRH